MWNIRENIRRKSSSLFPCLINYGDIKAELFSICWEKWSGLAVKIKQKKQIYCLFNSFDFKVLCKFFLEISKWTNLSLMQQQHIFCLPHTYLCVLYFVYNNSISCPQVSVSPVAKLQPVKLLSAFNQVHAGIQFWKVGTENESVIEWTAIQSMCLM